MSRIDTERLADEIAELAAHLDAATHQLLTLIGRFDESEAWGDRSTSHHPECSRSLRQLAAVG